MEWIGLISCIILCVASYYYGHERGISVGVKRGINIGVYIGQKRLPKWKRKMIKGDVK